MNTSNNDDGDVSSSQDAKSINDTSPSHRRQSSESAENKSAAPTPAAAATPSPELTRQPSSKPQPFHQDVTNNKSTATSFAATINNKPAHPIPRIRPCSLLPSSWSKRRIRISTAGCLASIVVCTARLLLLPTAPSAYVIHSIIILFDMVLIHVFTYTLWLSLAGECTAVVFAFCFHFTGETIFELLETTLIAVLVSFHMIRSRNEHWDREDDLERDMIGLYFYIEHNHEDVVDGDGDGGDGEEGRLGGSTLRRRISGLSKSDRCESDVETGRVFVPQHSMVTNLPSSFATNNLTHGEEGINKNGEESTAARWWDHFFEHFLDGSAGVMYTSFLGLIIDELVNYTSSPSSAKV